MVEEGFSEEHAQLMAGFRYFQAFLPAVHIAESTGVDLFAVSEVMSRLRQRLQLPLVLASLEEYLGHDRWDRLAQSGLRSSFLRQFVALARLIVSEGGEVNAYLSDRRQQLNHYLGLLDALKATPPTTLSPFMVLLRAMESLAD